MATTFRIKRSPTTGNPATLAQGELAYSYLTNNGSNGGDTLYIGTGTETTGNAANHVKIGGLYYTTQIDNATNLNTASTIVKRDSSGNFVAGTITAALTGNASTATKWFTARNLSLTGDATATLSSVDGSGDVSAALTLANVNSNVNSLAITAASGNGTTVTLTYATQASNPYTIGQQVTVTGVTPSGYNGTYTVTSVSTTQVQFASSYTTSYVNGGTVIGLFGSTTFIPVITVNAKGLITAITNTAISTSLNLAGSTGTGVVAGGGTLTVTGGAGISTTVSGSTITINSTGAGGYTTTATAAGTTTLTATSTPAQYFTGSTTQTVALPSTSTLVLGQEFIITNNSTGNLSVQTSTAAAVLTQIPGTTVSYTVISTSGNTAAAWNYEYTGFAAITGTGSAVLATSPTLVTPVLGAATATSIVASAGFVSTNTYGGSFSDGLILDYDNTNGIGRISAGTGDQIIFYNAADTTRVKLLTIGASGALTLTSDIIGTATQNVFNTVSTTVNAFGAATTLAIGGATSTTTFGTTSSNNTVSISGNSTGGTATLTTNVTTGIVNLFNGVTTGTVNIAGGGASTINIGGTGSTTVVKHLTVEGTTSSGATGTGNIVFASSPTITTPTISGHPTIEGQTLTGVFGTGNLVLSNSPTITTPTISGHPSIEGVISTGATGTGNLVFSASPTFTGTLSAATISATTLSVNNINDGYSTTATAAGTTTLTSSSNYQQYFTGSTTQTVVLPVVSTLVLGAQYQIVNNSTGNVTVQSSGANNILVVLPGTTAIFTVIAITGTTAASWSSAFDAFNTVTGTGTIVLATAPTFVTSIDSSSSSFTAFATPTTLTVGGASTSTTIGATTGTTTLNSPTIVGQATTQNLFNTVATTLNIGGASTSTTIGSSSSATLTLNPGTIVGANATQNLFNTTATTVNFAGAGTTVSIGASTGTTTVNNNLTATGTLAANGSSGITTSQTTFPLVNTTATTVNFAGAATAVNIGSTSAGTLTINNPTIATSVTSGTLALFNTGLTGTLNLAGAASSINIGSSTSTTTFNGNANVASGKGYQINGTTVLSGSTLGSTITASSLTSVSTITSGTWNATTIAVGYGGTGTNNGSITGTGALTFTAGSSNTNVNLVPQGTGTVDVGSKRITSLADPTGATDAATKQYVDAATQGLNVHDSVDIFADSTNTAITGAGYTDGTSDTSGGLGVGAKLTDATSGTVLSIDGYTVALGDRVLVNAFTSTSAKYNGIYTLTTVGVNGSVKWVLTRATDFNNSTSGQVRPGDFVFIYRGTKYATTGWVQTTIGTGTPAETIKIGTDSISFTQFSGAGVYSAGNGLTLTGTAFSIDTSITVDKTTAQTLTNKTLSTGVVYNGGVIGSTYGGTGVNNGSSTITIGGSVTMSGAYTFTGTVTGNTSVTFPTTGTLVNTAVTSLSSLSTVGTITSGTWNGTTIASGYGGTGFSTYATGDLIYASASNTLSKLSAATNGQILQLVSGVPAWGDLDGGTY